MPKQITSDNTVTLPDGTTIETVTYDDSSKSVTVIPGPGSPAANQATIQQQAAAALANNATFINSTATQRQTNRDAQILALTRQMNGLIRLAIGQLDATT